MKYDFEVPGYPPKKHGEKSMWNHEAEISKLIALRQKAFENYQRTLQGNIRLELTIFMIKNNKQEGDLDNYITGICDGLMTAFKGNTKISAEFDKYADIDPSTFCLFEDDSQIIEIVAKKNISENNSKHYRVCISEM